MVFVTLVKLVTFVRGWDAQSRISRVKKNPQDSEKSSKITNLNTFGSSPYMKVIRRSARSWDFSEIRPTLIDCISELKGS